MAAPSNDPLVNLAIDILSSPFRPSPLENLTAMVERAEKNYPQPSSKEISDGVMESLHNACGVNEGRF